MRILSRTICHFFPNTEIWRVESVAVGDEFRVAVARPERDIPGRSSAVLTTDAPWLGGTLTCLTRTLAMSGELPPLYAVSIGYPHASRLQHAIQRVRDLTPTARPDFDTFIATFHESAPVKSGGAKSFLTFIVEELMPALAAEFAINSDDSALAGSSLGGLFALYALLTSPVFSRYLAISPSVWWDGSFILNWARQSPPPASERNVTIALSRGALETPSNLKAQLAALSPVARRLMPVEMTEVDMPHDLTAIRQALEARFKTHVFDDVIPLESHTSVTAAAFSRGLRVLWDSLPRDNPSTAMEQ